MADKISIPVLVRDLDDDEATIIMVASHLQRERILPSEKDFTYKMKLEILMIFADRIRSIFGAFRGKIIKAVVSSTRLKI